jgi:hypothetical protein
VLQSGTGRHASRSRSLATKFLHSATACEKTDIVYVFEDWELRDDELQLRWPMRNLVKSIALLATLIGSTASAATMPGDALMPQDRDLVANYILTAFGQIDAKIPTLSPSEANWLKMEYDDQPERRRGARTVELALEAASYSM